MAALKNQPGHVPGWVWDEYQQAVRMKALALFEVSSSARPNLSDAERDLPTRIIADKGCKCVWTAIEKRKADAGASMSLRNGDAPAHVLMLFAQVKRFFLGPLELERVAGKTRADLGKKIAEQVTALRSSLAEVYSLGGIPDEIAKQLDQALQVASTGRIVPMGATSQDIFFSTDDTLNALAALARGAKAWALSKPVQYRASDGPHVYFIKSMSGYFEQCYGTPLHEQVAALTNCLFQKAITKAEVSNIVNKR